MTITEKREARTADSAGVDRPHVTVLLDRCAGCQECIIRCPTGALSLDPFTWTAVANDAACVGCRQCVRTCPFSAIVVEGPLVVDERIAFSARHPADLRHDHSETRQGISSWEAALSEASRCLDCPDPTCVRGCPAHNDIPGFIRAMRAGDLDEAHRILRRTSFMPDVCSRVCDWAIQCEGACTWSLAGGEPVAIGALERFVADNAPVPPLVPDPLAPGKDLDVAVVGSGPAGIGAASELVQAGARVTVYEREAEPGGLLRWGIPDFTLPDGVARRPWDTLVEAGVRLELRHEVSAAELDDLLARHDALILAAGASTPLWLPVPGSDLDRVWDATRFLTEARAALAEGRDLAELRPGGDGEPPLVLVLGAGNTAMDVARSARRFGARAICVDWMDRRYAPVRPDELNEAVEEGVEVRFCTTVERLEGAGGRVRYAHLVRTRQRSATERPKVLAGPTEVLPVDMVVMATGYRIANDVSEVGNGVPIPKTLDPVPDRRWQASGILANPAPPFARSQPVGVLSLGREHALVMSAFARRERIWVAGDALVGPSTVVEAMAQGKRAAQAVVHHAPRRKGGEQSPPRHVLVAVESRSGRTAAVAAELAGMLSSKGPTVKVLPMSDVGPEQLAWADALVIGTWVEGLVIAKVGPARAAKRWLRDLPPLGGMPVALLCTYAISPGSTLAAMRRAVEEHGGRVVAEAALAPRKKAERLAPALERIGMALAGRRTREEQRAVVHAAGSRHARTPGATT